jgi:GNAT superfamily N-acetyltransferase
MMTDTANTVINDGRKKPIVGELLTRASCIGGSVINAVIDMAISWLHALLTILNSLKRRSPTVDETYRQSMGTDEVTIRPARQQDDTQLVLDFILELARFEQLEDQVTATVASLHSKLFPRSATAPRPRVLILDINGLPAGFVLYFFNFSTFVGKSGIYIEDLYVREAHRGKGLGKLLLKRICQLAEDNDCGRVEWWCLDWNQKAIDFYLSLGAEQMHEWTVYRLNKATLTTIAAS